MDLFLLQIGVAFFYCGWLIFGLSNFFLVYIVGRKSTIRNAFSAMVFIAQIVTCLIIVVVFLESVSGLRLFHLTESYMSFPFYASMIGAWSLALNLTHWVRQRKRRSP